MTPAFALTCWERALSEEIGIIITLETLDDKRRIEKVLYAARKEANNPALSELVMCHPGDEPKEIWLVKRATDMTDIS